VKSISVPTNPDDPEEDWVFTQIFEQEAIGGNCIKCNQKHFGQAEGSPPTDKTMVHHLGKYGEGGSKGLAVFLDLDLSEYLEETIMVLEEMKTNRLPVIDATITTQDFRRAIRIWKERTSTSPSNRSLSHYHAITSPEDPDKDGNLPSDQVVEVMTIILNLCTKHGIALKRWLTIHNTMIEKVQGCDRLDKLRVIHIFEAGFNLILGIIWSRRMIKQAMAHDHLPPSSGAESPENNASM
jgi:hypothetical protein